MFNHSVYGPLKLLKEQWLELNPKEMHLLDYISKSSSKLLSSNCVGKINLKIFYDFKGEEFKLCPDDIVLVMLPTMGHPLKAKYHCPY